MIGLSPKETKEKQDTATRSESTTLSKKNFASIIFVSSLLIGISVVLSQFVFYDSNYEETEKVLQKLDSDYKIGKTLTNKEFALYCQLLEKIWKKHLKACYCKDGIKNPTPGIDWTNPPSSPEGLDSDWVDVTHPIAKEKSNRIIFRNRNTGEEIAFEIGRMRKDGSRLPNHWHRPNPESADDSDYYLDECGKPVRKSHDDSHIWIKGLTPHG
jgi:hypothetical protein